MEPLGSNQSQPHGAEGKKERAEQTVAAVWSSQYERHVAAVIDVRINGFRGGRKAAFRHGLSGDKLQATAAAPGEVLSIGQVIWGRNQRNGKRRWVA